MTAQDFISSGNDDKLDFKQIVLQQLKKILEISNSELRNKTTIINSGLQSSTHEQENTQVSYIQSIENLAYILMPHFDEEAQKVYDKCIPILIGYGFEIRKLLEEDYKLLSKNYEGKIPNEVFSLNSQIKYAKELFIALNLLLKRNDYLKSSIYTEEQ